MRYYQSFAVNGFTLSLIENDFMTQDHMPASWFVKQFMWENRNCLIAFNYKLWKNVDLSEREFCWYRVWQLQVTPSISALVSVRNYVFNSSICRLNYEVCHGWVVTILSKTNKTLNSLQLSLIVLVNLQQLSTFQQLSNSIICRT